MVFEDFAVLDEGRRILPSFLVTPPRFYFHFPFLSPFLLALSFLFISSLLLSLLQVRSVGSECTTAQAVLVRLSLRPWCWIAPLARALFAPKSRWIARARGSTASPSRLTIAERVLMAPTARNPTSKNNSVLQTSGLQRTDVILCIDVTQIVNMNKKCVLEIWWGIISLQCVSVLPSLLFYISLQTLCLNSPCLYFSFSMPQYVSLSPFPLPQGHSARACE